MVSRINTTNEKSIRETLQIGQRIRNGYNRWFQIVGLSSTQIALQAINGESSKITQFPLKVFVQLYARKNYVQILTDNPVREGIESHLTGAYRFLIQ